MLWFCLFALLTTAGQVWGSCPAGWTQHGESCYLVQHQKATWVTAKVMCDAVSGYLVEIESSDENSFVASLVKSLGVSGWPGAWTGLQDFAVEGDFKWTHSKGRPEFTNWYTGIPEPDDFQGNQDCVTLDENGAWDDYFCDSPAPAFVCEHKATGPIVG